MNALEEEVMEKLGLVITNMEVSEDPRDRTSYVQRASVIIDQERFGPMCRLVKIVDMIAESKSSAVEEAFNHLITLLELTKKNG